MPEAVALPGSISLVVLTVNGARVALPERAGDSLRLGAAREQTQVDQFDAHIYRKLTDAIPGLLTTRLTVTVAGRPREEVVGPLLPAGFVPMQLAGPLPARLQPDGRLRVQVRPGTWTLELTARSASALESVRRPDSGVAEEVWSFEPVDRLRASAVEGASSIDPSQANVPSDWARLPAYRLSPGDQITVAERSRGPGDEDRNQIAVERNLWWDFAGTGYTFQDLVSGRMQQDWRLAMAEPYRLQGARQNGQPLLVTQGEDDRAGVEVRTPDLGVEATGRIEQRGALPASGWTTRLASLGDDASSSAGASAARDIRRRQLAVGLARPLEAARHLRRAARRRRRLPRCRRARGRALACGIHAYASRAAGAYLGGAQPAGRDRHRARDARRPGARVAWSLALGRPRGRGRIARALCAIAGAACVLSAARARGVAGSD
jgi:hypothetical protein